LLLEKPPSMVAMVLKEATICFEEAIKFHRNYYNVWHKCGCACAFSTMYRINLEVVQNAKNVNDGFLERVSLNN
jgi:hypothetical protein